MNPDDQQRKSSQQEPPFDMGDSLGYGQGMEHYSLNPTRPLRLNLSLPSHEERFHQLRAARLRRQQSRGEPHHASFFARRGRKEAPRVQTSGRTGIVKATLILTAALVTSRFLGVLRSLLFAIVFGAGTTTPSR